MMPCRICYSDRIPCECWYWYMNKLGRYEDKQLSETFKELMKEANMGPKTTTIHHPEYGRVEEVTRSTTYEPWWKDERGGRMYYYASKGWKETPRKRDITGEVELEKDGNGQTIFWLNKKDAYMSPDITFTKAQAVVLPEGMNWRDWLNKHYLNSPDNLVSVLLIHTTTVIQVWQEGK